MRLYLYSVAERTRTRERCNSPRRSRECTLHSRWYSRAPPAAMREGARNCELVTYREVCELWGDCIASTTAVSKFSHTFELASSMSIQDRVPWNLRAWVRIHYPHQCRLRGWLQRSAIIWAEWVREDSRMRWVYSRPIIMHLQRGIFLPDEIILINAKIYYFSDSLWNNKQDAIIDFTQIPYWIPIIAINCSYSLELNPHM